VTVCRSRTRRADYYSHRCTTHRVTLGLRQAALRTRASENLGYDRPAWRDRVAKARVDIAGWLHVLRLQQYERPDERKETADSGHNRSPTKALDLTLPLALLGATDEVIE
jgi:hypothetical protein